MQSVALTESCLYPADDDFVVVEPLSDSTNADDDDSYDYCDDVFDQPTPMEVDFDEGMHWKNGASVMMVGDSFPQNMLDAASSLLLSGIAEVGESACDLEIRTSFADERNGHHLIAQLESLHEAASKEEEQHELPQTVFAVNQSPSHTEKDFGHRPSDEESTAEPATPSCNNESTEPSATIDTQCVEKPSPPNNSVPKSHDTEEPSSLLDPKEDAILAVAEEAENKAWPSRGSKKQRRLTNKKRRKQMKLARKAAAAAAAIVAHGTSIPHQPQAPVAAPHHRTMQQKQPQGDAPPTKVEEAVNNNARTEG